MIKSSDSSFASDVIYIFIGGSLDSRSRIVSGYSKAFSKKYPGTSTYYFAHHQQKEIVSVVLAATAENAPKAIHLVGHSWGAVTAIKAANQLADKGVNVDQVITIDPVGRRRISVTAKATAWINVNAAPATSNGWNGDYYATLGGKWADWPRGRARVHYWAPCHHNEFASLLECVALDGECALNYLTGPARIET